MRRAPARLGLFAAAAALTIGLTAPIGPARADTAPTLSLSELTPGNIFVDGQQVQVGLATSASSVSWSAADVNGTAVASGSQAAASTLTVPVTTHGWYQLTVTAAQGTATAAAQTTFAVLAQPGQATSAGLSTQVLGGFENTAEGWTFSPGSEYPGATGSFGLDTSNAHTGAASGLLSGDFSGGGAYVGVSRAVPGVAATGISLWVKAPSLAWLTVRLTDSTGQVHQQRLTLSRSSDWQPLAVTRFDAGSQYTYWGGADDGVWHGPAQGLELVLDRGAIIGGASSASFNVDDVVAYSPAAARTIVIGDFESTAEGWSFYPGSEYPGAAGSFGLDSSTAQTGASSGRLSGDFSGGGAYVEVQRSFTPADLSSLTLWVRATQLSAIALRLTDSTGQVHQQQLSLSGSTGWQQLTVTRFDGGNRYVHWGGAGDGIWHGPAQAIAVVLDRGFIIAGGTSASVNIDAVTGVVPGPLSGVSTHFGQSWSTDLVPLIAKTGARGARDEAYWQNVELTPGTYTFPSNVTSYLRAWQNNQLDALMVADYGNPNYDGGSAPYDAAGQTAFANYADALVSQYPQIRNLAIWNEWDVNASGPANMTPASYLAVLTAAYSKVKTDHPGTTVVGGGDVDVNQLAWFESFCALGGLRYLDVVSIHPYDYLGPPEGLGAAIDQVRALIRKYNNGIDKPVWITEDGWPTGTSQVAVPEPAQAAFLARALAVAMAHGVQRFYVYDFMNDGTDPANPENNFGLVRGAADAAGAYTPKPAYVGYAVAARQLAGAAYLGQENPGNGLYDEIFAAADGSPLRVIWLGSGANTSVTVTSGGPVQVTSLYGLPSTFYPDANGHVTIWVGTWPTYVSGAAISAVTSP
jgi:hypothetical protein